MHCLDDDEDDDEKCPSCDKPYENCRCLCDDDDVPWILEDEETEDC